MTFGWDLQNVLYLSTPLGSVSGSSNPPINYFGPEVTNLNIWATWWKTKRLLLCWPRNCSKDLQFKFKNTVLNSAVVTGYAYKKIRSLTHIIYKKNFFFRQDQELNIKYQISKTFRRKCRDLNDLGVWNRFLK